jgi:hypothetical protein
VTWRRCHWRQRPTVTTRLSVDAGGHADAGFGGEFLDRGEGEAELPRRAVTIARARGCSLGDSAAAARREQFLHQKRLGVDGATAMTRGLAGGERAGLVDQQSGGGGEALEGGGVLHEHAGLGAATDAGDERHRRGEAEGAGAGDDEDGDGVEQRVGEAWLGTERQPEPEGDARRARARRA